MLVECRFLFSAHRLMTVYICTKFHENIMNGIRVIERTRKVNGRTDRRTDGRHDIIRPVFDGRMKMQSSIRVQHNDVTSCKHRHLIVKHHWCKGVSICYNHRKFGKASFINHRFSEISSFKMTQFFYTRILQIAN